MTTRHRTTIGAACALVALAACAGAAEDEPASGPADRGAATTGPTVETTDARDDAAGEDGDGVVSSTVATSDMSDASDPSDASDASDDGTEPIVLPLESDADPAELRFETLATLGGLRVGIDPSHRLITAGDVVGVDPDPSGSKYWNAPAMIGLVTQSFTGEPISSVDDYLAAAAGAEAASIEPTGDAIELFDATLVGYRFEQPPGMETTPMFATARVGAPIFGAWWPYPHGRVYLADTEAGVLAAGVTGVTPEQLDAAWSVFADLATHADLIGDIDHGAGDVVAFRPDTTVDRPVPADPVGDLPILDRAYFPLRPDTYQVLNSGDRWTVDIPTGWAVKPNTSGFVVLAVSHSFGPLNSSIVALTDVVRGQPATSAPVPLGQPVDLTDLDSFLAAPPPSLEVSGVADTVLGRRPAVRFDISFADDVDCSATAPCVFALATASGVVDQLRSGFHMRIWVVEAGAGSIWFVTSSTDADELDTIEQVVESIELD